MDTNKTAFEYAGKEVDDKVLVRTYDTSGPMHCRMGADSVQAIDDWPKPFDQFWVAIPEFVEGLGLFFKYDQDVVGGFAAVEHGREWMFGEAFPSPFSVLCQGGIEKYFEIRGRGGRVDGRRHRDIGLTGGLWACAKGEGGNRYGRTFSREDR